MIELNGLVLEPTWCVKWTHSILAVLEMELRTSNMLDKYSSTELHGPRLLCGMHCSYTMPNTE